MNDLSLKNSLPLNVLGKKKRILFTVTTDLTYDQRMIRICTSLAEAGFDVTLVGRKLSRSLPLTQELFKQRRINCIFKKGKLFYIEYNTRLFLFTISKNRLYLRY